MHLNITCTRRWFFMRYYHAHSAFCISCTCTSWFCILLTPTLDKLGGTHIYRVGSCLKEPERMRNNPRGQSALCFTSEVVHGLFGAFLNDHDHSKLLRFKAFLRTSGPRPSRYVPGRERPCDLHRESQGTFSCFSGTILRHIDWPTHVSQECYCAGRLWCE